MRLSELVGKEVINLHDGVRVGSIEEGEVIFDSATGQIKSLLVPERGFFSFFGRGNMTKLSWSSIRRIGADFVIIDLAVKDQIQSESVFWPKQILKSFHKEE